MNESNQEELKETTDKTSLPKNIQLNDIIDNILYERPVLDEKDQERELNVYDHIIIVATIRYIQKTSPMDDVQREYVLAYLNQTIDKFNNWGIYVMNLLIRSLTEFNEMKKRERSLLQLHQIAEDWNIGKEDTYERQKYMFTVNFPSYNEYQMIIIDKYKNMGMFMSA